jgi:hypothetical protein
MMLKKKRGMVMMSLSLVLFLFLILQACVGFSSDEPQGVQVVYPTIVITQYVTQVVATPTNTLPPPSTQAVAATQVLNVGWDPFSAPIYYPIIGCVASRLHEDDVAFVANAGSEGIHWSKDIGYAPIYRKLIPGELMDIDKGPWCSNGAIIWKVITADGYTGFVPEGDGNVYYLLPMPPGTDKVWTKSKFQLQGPAYSQGRWVPVPRKP